MQTEQAQQAMARAARRGGNMYNAAVQGLDEIDKELLRLKLEKPARTYLELATEVGMSWRSIARRVSAEHFQRTLVEAQKKAIEIIQDAKTKAIRNLVKIACYPITDDLMKQNPKAVSNIIRAAVSIAQDELPEMKVKHSGNVNHTIYDGLKYVVHAPVNAAADGIAEKPLNGRRN